MKVNFDFVKNDLNLHLVVYRVMHYNEFNRSWENIGEAISYSLAELIIKDGFFIDDDRSNYKIVESSVLCGLNKEVSFVQSHFGVK